MRKCQPVFSIIVAMGIFLAIFSPRSALAQSVQTEYCYGTCYPTLQQAEQAMRAANPNYAAYLQQKDVQVGSGSGSLTYFYMIYGVPDQPPTQINPVAYNAYNFPNPAPASCVPSSNPAYPTMCADEASLVAALVASYQSVYGNSHTVEHVLSGSHANPYFESSGFELRHTLEKTFASGARKLQVLVYRISDGSLRHSAEHALLKWSTFSCPAGFSGVSGRHPAYVDGTQSNVLAPPYLCRANIANQWITTRLRQTKCDETNCPTNPVEGTNPSFPATGDKARFETDFSFAGRPFERTYHSLRQLGQLPELAPGWVHSYSDRVTGDPSYLSNPLLWINDRGYVEVFRRVGSSNRFFSEGNASSVLDVETSTSLPHKYVVTSGNGALVRYFTASGRLLRLEERDTGNKIMFAYEGVRLVSATDLTGRKLSFEYASDGRLSGVRQPDDALVTYTYDANRNLASATYPDGALKTYHYNETGLSDAGDVNALTGISENGQRYASYAYESKGRVRLSQFHTAGGPVGVTQLAYTGDTQVQVTGYYGESRTYTLSSVSGYRRATAMSAADGSTSSTLTGALVQEYRDKLNNATRYEYAADKTYSTVKYQAYGTALERRRVTSRNAAYRVDSLSIQAKVSGSYVPKQAHAYTYNARNQVLTHTVSDPATSASRITTRAYCEQVDVDNGSCPFVGLLKSVDGPRTDVSDVTSYVYRMADDAACATSLTTCAYRKGDFWKSINALGQASEILSYDGAGRVLASKDVNGITTHSEYDAAGRMTASKIRGANDASEADDRITRIEYWPDGLVKKVTQPDGSYTSYGYDGANRLTSIADAEGNTITYTLDGAGNQTGEQVKDDQGALMRSLTRTYNTLGQLQSQTDAYGRVTSFTYDANGDLDQSTDALTRVADNNTDPLGRLTRTLQDMNGIAAETQFSYDALDNLTQVNDPKGLNTTYTYNGLGDQTQLQSPDTGSTTYTYDSAGNRASQTDARGVTTTYGYDALNRLTSVSVPTSSLNIGYVYDSTQAACQSGEGYGVGRLTRIDDGSGSTVYCYNRFGDLVRKVQTTNGQSFTLRYQYNAAGQLTGMVYPDGASVDYAYDALGRVSEIGATPTGGTRQVVLTNATYYPFGPVAEWSYGNGRLMKRSLNQNYQPGFVEVVGAGGLSLGYEFDQVGNLKRLRGADQADPPRRVFGYDGLNRLTENRDGVSNALLEGYAYDKTGNRTSATVGATTTPYSYPAGSHRLDSVGATARSYDNVGNTTQIGGTAKEFVYNDLNRMSQYRESGVAKMNYVYNGRGEQVRKHLGSSDTYSVYDEAGRWVGDYSGSGTPVQQVVWFGDLPVAVLDGASTAQKLYYVEADMLGTPRVVVDPVRGATGTVVWTWDLAGEAFGNTAPNQDPDGDAAQFVFNMRFPGQRYDAASGLNYNYFRDYEASTGRYVESDPIGLEGGLSTYGYVGGNSLIDTDALGLAKDKDKDGGPYHPPKRVKLSCKSTDTCSSATGKMFVLARMIYSHQWWDWRNPKPRGGNRHHQEIKELWSAYAQCSAIAFKKCSDKCKQIPVPRLPVVPIWIHPPGMQCGPNYELCPEMAPGWGEA